MVEETGARGRVCFLSMESFSRGDVGFRQRRRALKRRSFTEVGGGIEVNEEGSNIRGEVDGGEEKMGWREYSSGWTVGRIVFGAHISGFEY